MPPSCVNGGGPASRLQLPVVPVFEQEVELDPAMAATLRSWEARPGEILTTVDPEHGCHRLRLTSVGATARGVVIDRFARPVESRVAIEVYQALPEKERFELILQKLTELGVTRIVPVETRHSITLEQRDAGQAKSHRWPAVILRAARQCRRAMLPELFSVASFEAALSLAGDAELKLMLYEGETGWTLTEALGRLRPERVALLVGPEGGFADDEVESARAAGFLPISLGPRILRTETAALAGAALLQGLLGDLC